MIEVRNCVKRFGPTVAVRDISFSVPKGEVLGLLGPNGAGKTTTMRILTCYMPADEGSVSVAGFDVDTESIEVRKRIGYLPENAPLYKEMYAQTFLDFLSRIRGIPPEQRKARMDDVIDICGLEEVLHKRIGEMSKGYQQRVGLAQTLIHNPDVLILDEPTTGLDPNQIKEIRNLIKEIGREKTVILSTHILPEVQATTNRVLIMSHGRLVADGTPDELARQTRGTDSLVVQVRGPMDTIRERFMGIDEVSSVEHIETEDEFHSIELLVSDRSSSAEKVFTTVVEHGWTLRELHSESRSLEEVFYELTVGEREEQ